LTSNVEVHDGRVWCSTRSRRATARADVEHVVRSIARDELVVEEWFPKMGFGGGTADLRVLVVGGEPRHTVVRVASGPITNLNLGNRRGDVNALRERMGPAWESMLDMCRRVAAAFPGCLYLGVDVLVSPGFRTHCVAEVNAFGDLLPGVRSVGDDAFEAEVGALVARDAGFVHS
jgi:hypothetical protein